MSFEIFLLLHIFVRIIILFFRILKSGKAQHKETKVFTVKFDPLYVVFLNKCVLFSNSCMVVHVSYCDGTLGRGGLGGLGKCDVG